MKGLLVKDFCLLKGQKMFFIILILLTLGLSNILESVLFIASYLMFFVTILAMGTISYDEYDNGSAFLFTLPISRKLYVQEKYVLGLLMGTVVCLFCAILILGHSLFSGDSIGVRQELLILAFYFLLLVFLLSFSFPLQLKFGSEKGRIAIAIFFMVIFLLVYGSASAIEKLKIDIEPWVNRVYKLEAGVLILAGVIIGAVMLWISYSISVRIEEKKEF